MTQRIESIDVIRGMSIIGILFMNILGFHYYDVYSSPFEYYTDPLSRGLYKINMLFVHNSFYPIFAFLFGFGLAIMYRNLQRKEMNPAIVLYRRIGFMLIFGIIHGTLLFSGDILHTYALLAVVAIPFLFKGKNWALGVGLALFVLNILALISLVFSDEAIETSGLSADDGDKIMSAIDNHQLIDIMQWNAQHFITEHIFCPYSFPLCLNDN